jgi:hypothetical protein
MIVSKRNTGPVGWEALSPYPLGEARMDVVYDTMKDIQAKSTNMEVARVWFRTSPDAANETAGRGAAVSLLFLFFAQDCHLVCFTIPIDLCNHSCRMFALRTS